MGYTSVRGGLDAIRHAERLIADAVNSSDDPLRVPQLLRHLSLAIAKAMSEGALYDPELGALAVKQAEGDSIEAALALRAYRSTLPRLGYSLPSRSEDLRVLRRISATYRDIPGGQLLGRTRDYTLRLLDLGLRREDAGPLPDGHAAAPRAFPVVIDFLREEGLLAPAPAAPPEGEPYDVTREPLRFPAPRSARLQVLARGEAGAMLSLAYGAMRGYGSAHAYVGELRQGEVPVSIFHPITGRRARIGWIPVTEAHIVFPGQGSKRGDTTEFSLGYGITVGRDERKAISMGILDENLSRAAESADSVAQNEEYVLYHIDPVESSGFVEHLKLPHYVTFQSQLHRSRRFAELMKAARRDG